jgi:hypothetical protein
MSTTPYSVIPCQVSESSAGTPGPVFCWAIAGAAARALNMSNVQLPSLNCLKSIPFV